MPVSADGLLLLNKEICNDGLTHDGEERAMTDVANYSYRGAGAMVQLHQQHLRSFFDVWQRARELGVAMPTTEDPDCASLEALLSHVLAAARGYMMWMCKVLRLGNPEIEKAPTAGEVEGKAGEYLEHLISRWDGPLVGVEEEAFFSPAHSAPWGVETSVDAMLEHAVMHAIRHQFQLESLLKQAENCR
ncbi:MAG TPA: hypothetical protein EYN79_10115 [Planctomycetes bacterium]|nr:hypothetical protein [Planctomycetota bacterium]